MAKAKDPATAKGPAKVKRGPRLNKPIDLYYWPTPNGWKISIMLEECGLPYNVIPVNIAKGDQFEPAFLKISTKQPDAGDRRHPTGQAGGRFSVFEFRRHPAIPRPQDRKFYPAGERARVAVTSGLSADGNLGPRPAKPITSALCAERLALRA